MSCPHQKQTEKTQRVKENLYFCWVILTHLSKCIAFCFQWMLSNERNKKMWGLVNAESLFEIDKAKVKVSGYYAITPKTNINLFLNKKDYPRGR